MKRQLFKIIGLLGAGILILCFQNCSDMVVQDNVIYQSSLAEYQKDLDQKNLPVILSSNRIAYWSKPSNVNFVSLGNNLYAEQWSVVIAVDKATASGTLFSFNSGTESEEGRISIVNGKIRATHVTDTNNYSYVEGAVPSVGSKMLIAASFGTDPTQITLLVNGIIQNTSVVKTGVPGVFSWVQKNIGSTSPAVLEAFVHAAPDGGDTLNSGQLNVMSRYIAGENLIPNVIYDPALMAITDGGSGGTIVADPLYVAAKAVIDAKCLDCHGSGSSKGVFANLTAAKAVAGGWVVPGNPYQSTLYDCLTGSLSGFAVCPSQARGMPQNSSLSAAEVKAIADWISSIK